MKLELTATGLLELRLSDDPDVFTSLAEAVRVKLGGRWSDRVDHLDQSYWDLEVGGTTITIHREHCLGVSVFCKDEPPTRALLESIKASFEARQ